MLAHNGPIHCGCRRRFIIRRSAIAQDGRDFAAKMPPDNRLLVGIVVVGLALVVPLTAGLFEQCNHLIELQAGHKVYINSPYYPQKYPSGTSCRYTIQAPTDHQLQFSCNLQLDSPLGATRCLNEVFYFNREGSELLSGSEYFCGSGTVERGSFLNRAVISYISTLNLKRKLPALKATTTTAAAAAAPKTVDASATDVGASNALAYLLTLLSKNLSASQLIRETRTAQPNVTDEVLPSITRRSSTAAPPARVGAGSRIIVADSGGYGGDGGGGGGGADGGGRFSCRVEVMEPQCECGWSVSVKIADSAGVAGVNEFPSMAGVLTVRQNKIFCGAAIIHHRWLLSAAHCFSTPETNRSELIRIAVGEHDISTVFESLYTRSYEIDQIMPHEHFRASASSVRNDIALLRTRTSIEWNRGVGPACLPFRSIAGTAGGGQRPPVAGQRVDTAGWGTTSFGGPQSTVLLKTTLDVISSAECLRIVTTLPAATFCTYTPGRDTCQYDSGGALYVRRGRIFAVGIVSYGFACATQQPSVNTKVGAYLRWIRSKTPDVKYCIK